MDKTAETIEPRRHREHGENTESLPENLNDLATRVIGAAIEVHRHLGPGFLEATYAKALAIELAKQNIPFQCEAPIVLTYQRTPLG